MDCVIFTGRKTNYKLLYIHEQKMIYQKKSNYKDIVKYECWIRSCKSRVNLMPNGKCVLAKNYVEHNHSHQEDAFKELKVLNKIKTDCVDVACTLRGEKNAISSIRKAFEENCERHQDDSKNITFSKIRRGLEHIVSKNNTPSPKTALDVIEAFQLEHVMVNFGITKDEAKPEHFFTACILEKDVSYCLFSSKKSINLIRENILPRYRTYLMDATFSSVPKGCFRQHLIIYIQHLEEIFPIFFVLMNKKTFAAYAHLLKYINENIFNMEPNTFITDYEEAMRRAVRNQFPTVKLVGCWFHFCQAIRRNVSQNRMLLQFIKRSQPAMREYKKLMVLPLLPPALICGAFQDIKSKILLMDGERLFGTFLNYYEKQWLKKVGHNNISVYHQTTRTTSSVEAYNGTIGKLVQKNGNFFKYVQAIRNEEFFKSRHFAMLCGSGPPQNKRWKRSSKESIIVEGTLLLEEAKITVANFLERMTHDSNGVCCSSFPEETEHVEDFDEHPNVEEDEDADLTVAIQNIKLCIICLEIHPNIVLLPCKHLILCDGCYLKLQADAIAKNEEGHKCLCCRADVQDSMQIYN